MPPEWAPHRGTWLSWPHKEASWPGGFEPVPGIFAEIVRHLVPREEVHINVGDADLEDSARRVLHRAGVPTGMVFFHRNPTNDAWCRDHGPVFVHQPTPAGPEELILDWGYNAWGNKYPPFDLDDVVPTRIGAELGIPVIAPGMILEGGSIDVNGAGTLLTTEQCLLNPNRNPGRSRPEIEAALLAHLGARNVLWLGDGIEGDDTDGHVDDLTRFVDPVTVVTVLEEDPRDSNYAPLRDNRERLRRMTDQDGRPLRVIELPMPPALSREGQRLPASHANFYIANGVVLLPGFGGASDARARSVLQDLFPTRRVVVIDCTDLVWGLGAIHCVTQQWPALSR
ncbi:MAG TPA: agmatine deiminase family protein [Gemmatimonadales bacterium]|nr:agmatine deiminase family protein [Gemmatimonadales bacterium]